MALKMAIACAGFLACATPALSQDDIRINYDISMGGARIMKANYVTTLDAEGYSTNLEANTTGMSKLFSKITLIMSATGTVDDGLISPKNYKYFRKKNSKRKERALSFTRKGSLIIDEDDFEPAIRAATGGKVMDPLTMLLRLSRSDSPCSGKHRAFDGRDVFDISLGKKSGGDGKVICNITYVPVAGGDVDEGDTEAKTYQMVLAPLENAKGYVPVLISGSTKGVGFEVSAQTVVVNGTALDF